MATHFYSRAEHGFDRSVFFSKKSLMGSRLGSALIHPCDLLQKSEGVSPVSSQKNETPTLGRSLQRS